MIPEHLRGKSAAVLINGMRDRWFDNDGTETGYMNYLEGLLLIALKDALCVCDDVGRGALDSGPAACGRAIAFLNQVGPDDSTPSQN